MSVASYFTNLGGHPLGLLNIFEWTTEKGGIYRLYIIVKYIIQVLDLLQSYMKTDMCTSIRSVYFNLIIHK